jgi:hypothetical protein
MLKITFLQKTKFIDKFKFFGCFLPFCLSFLFQGLNASWFDHSAIPFCFVHRAVAILHQASSVG